MALLTKIFQNRKNARSYCFKTIKENEKQTWKGFSFEKSSVRMVLFRDNDTKGRALLFDSAAVHSNADLHTTRVKKMATKTVPPEKGPPKPGKDMPPKYSVSKKKPDTDVFKEMMYGSVAMAYKGSSIKIHSMRDSQQFMLTKIFVLTKREVASELDRESFDGGSISSILQDGVAASVPLNAERITVPLTPLSMAQSIPMEIPSPPRPSGANENEDSGFAASGASSPSSLGTSLTSPGSASSSFTNSYNSLHRRLQRNVNTSFEHTFQKRQSNEGGQENSGKKKHCTFALGLIFSLPSDPEKRKHFEAFFFSHITLIERHLNALQISIEKSTCRRSTFIQNTMDAMDIFCGSIQDLYQAPRLSRPVWLNLMCFNTHRVSLCQQYLKDFVSIADRFDTKGNNFFFSALLTAVLTYHLAWVPTVTPAGELKSRVYLKKHSAKWLDTLAQSHPYNPLWAQLGDLYGAIGFPLRICRTVVVGKKADIVCRLLNILSYLVRCSDILENCQECPTLGPMDVNKLKTPQEMTAISETSLIENTVEDSSIGEVNFNFSIESELECKEVSADLAREISDELLYPADRNPPTYQTLEGSQPPSYSAVNIVDNDVTDDISDCKELNISHNNDIVQHVLNQSMSNSDSTLKSGESETTMSPCSSPIQVSANNSNGSSADTDLLSKTDKSEVNAECCHLSQVKSEENVNICKIQYVQSEPNNLISTSKSFLFNKECTNLDSDANEKMVSRLHVIEASLDTKCVSLDSGMYDESSYDPAARDEKLPISKSENEDRVKVIQATGETVVGKSDHSHNIVFTRNNSAFDEYFTEDTMPIPDIMQLKMENESGLEAGKVSIEPAETDQSAPSSQSSLTMLDEYFSEMQDSVNLPAGMAQQQIQQAIQLMQQSTRDELLPDDAGHHDNDRKHRPDSLSLKSVSAPLSRQNSSVTSQAKSSEHGLEFSRQRHASSLSTASSVDTDFFLNLQEMPMPSIENEDMQLEHSYQYHFGRSLMAAYTDHYLSDFVLHGTSDTNLHSRLHSDLMTAVQLSVIDEPISEAACIVADTDKWKVQVHSCQYAVPDRIQKQDILASQFVLNMVGSVRHLHKLKMSSEFCLMHLEDKLQELYFKSLMLSEYICKHHRIDIRKIANMLSIDLSDLPLLVAVAATHTPQLANFLK